MEFNAEQQAIIDSITGAYLISAPVGTGKTTVLTERVVKAIESGIKPEQILCLTFTNRAAEEMVERIKKRLGKKELYDKVCVKTFHGFCAYFIKTEAKRLGLPHDLTIFDDAEQVELMKSILEGYPELAVDEEGKGINVFELIEEAHEHRMRQFEKEIGCNVVIPEIDSLRFEIGEKYRAALAEQHALDFNELVYQTIKALYTDVQLHKKWSEQFRFIQVDEFQDTHLSEYLVVKELAKGYRNISFIGDLDQTIYSWRGSEPYKIAAYFKAHFAPVTELFLSINYRSSNELLSVVKSFLTSYKRAATKRIESLHPSSSQERCVELFGAYNFKEEISWVVDSIKKIQASEPGAKIAVLARNNFQINQTAEIFAAKGVAHVTVDTFDFFRRQEVKDLYAYLKILFNSYDLESAYRLVQRPPRNIGLTTIKAIRETGGPLGLRVLDFLQFRHYAYREPYAHLLELSKKGRVVVLDTETTGTDVTRDEIIQVYAVEVVDGKIGKEFHYHVKNTIPVGASALVHGLSDAYLAANGKEPAAVLKELKAFIGTSPIIGHNITFDRTMILENAKRHDIELVCKEYYDTLDIAKRVVVAPNYKLTTLAELFGLSTATHDARDDVRATVELLAILVEKLGEHQHKREQLWAEYSKKFLQLSTQIDSWRRLVAEARPSQALSRIWEESGLKAYYEKDAARDKRLQSIETLKKLFSERDDVTRAPDVMLRELIQYASLVKDLNFLGLDQGKIPIVTIHQVKGLEFDHVFIVHMNESRFPHYRSDLEEEKRLFYVALTRARKKMYISYSNFNDYDKPLQKSTFISFLDTRYIEHIT